LVKNIRTMIKTTWMQNNYLWNQIDLKRLKYMITIFQKKKTNDTKNISTIILIFSKKKRWNFLNKQ